MSIDGDKVAAAALCSLLETADPAQDNESDRGDYFNVTPLDEQFQTYGSNMSEEVEIQSSENPAMDFSQESTQNTSSSSPATSPLVHDCFHSYHSTESGNIIKERLMFLLRKMYTNNGFSVQTETNTIQKGI